MRLKGIHGTMRLHHLVYFIKDVNIILPPQPTMIFHMLRRVCSSVGFGVAVKVQLRLNAPVLLPKKSAAAVEKSNQRTRCEGHSNRGREIPTQLGSRIIYICT